MQQRRTALLLIVGVITVLFAVCLTPLVSALKAGKTQSKMLKFGLIQPTLYFDGSDRPTSTWSLSLLTPESHYFIPHNPDFEPGFTPETYPKVETTFVFNDGAWKTSCQQPYEASPTNFLNEITCPHYTGTPISSIAFDSMAIGLLPTADVKNQSFPKFRFFDEVSKKELIFELDKKPWGTKDYQTDINSSFIYPTPFSFINEVTNHLEFRFSMNLKKKNTSDKTFSIELLGDSESFEKDIPEYIFNIHNPKFDPTIIPSPVLTTVNMTANLFNKPQAVIEMSLMNNGASLNITSGEIPSGYLSSFSLPGVTIIRNPKANFDSKPIIQPRFRLRSVHYQADIDYLLDFVPIEKTDYSEKKTNPDDDDTTTPKTSHYIITLLIGMFIGAIIVIGVIFVRSTLAAKKQNELNIIHSSESGNEPLLIS